MTKTTYIFLPPLTTVSGGLHVLWQLGRHILAAGHKAAFVTRESLSLPPACAPIPVVPWQDLRLIPEDIWLVPEGWATALAPGLSAGARCIVYVQNWAFALGVLPPEARWDQLPVDFIHVSEPVRFCLHEATGKDGPVLRPGIEAELFYPAPLARAESPVQGNLRIAWMPRKNKALAQQIKAFVQERLPRLYPEWTLEWVEIQGRSRAEVAQLLRESHIFLATGFPEGCPLPPLEAMASGCVLAGFAGLGGWDYMRNDPASTLPFLARPWCPSRPVHWGSNGFFVADADSMAAALAVEEACKLLTSGGPALAQMRQNLALTARAYSVQEQGAAVAALWNTYN